MRTEKENVIMLISIYIIFILPFIYFVLIMGGFIVETTFTVSALLVFVTLGAATLAFITANEQLRSTYIMLKKNYGRFFPKK
ncbi:MAG: hypothetical protein ACTSW1_15190 [Candidatus Hodarchaeales archaeon]